MLRRFYVLITAFTLLASLSTAQVVNIPDPNLERVIRDELDISGNLPLTQADMLRLTHAGWSNEGISDLTGIEHAENLVFMVLGANPIKDLTPISRLPRLEELNIASIPTKNLNWMSNMTQLKDVFAIQCQIEDISALAGLINLVALDLAVNRISDISVLANLTALEKLHIEVNQIVDVSPISNLNNLKSLHIFKNDIVDFSPIESLNIDDIWHDEECLSERPSIQDRIDGRSMPSIFLPWNNGVANIGGMWWSESIPYNDRVAAHDIQWGIDWHLYHTPVDTDYVLLGDMRSSVSSYDDLVSKNPNMLFLFDHRQQYAGISHFGPDWFGWLRDDDGSYVPSQPDNPGDQFLINYKHPDFDDDAIKRIISTSKCGLFDGIMFDAWGIDRDIPREDWYSLIRKIRESVPDEFLILFNTNHWYIPELAPFINGAFMETFPHVRVDGYTRDRIVEIETNLIKYESTVREPRINCLRGFGIGSEPPDSPNNRKWMRLFTTMSLTCSDGYVLYSIGDVGGVEQFQKHIQHSFWTVDLGQPISPTVQKHDEIEGLYIREFTNGWAVYNRSGSAHVVTLPEKTRSVQSGIENDSQVVLDLDGDIFLKIKTDPADVNSDGVVNILDLVIVAESLGTGENDVNGDGVTNVFDLVIVAAAIQ